ncbi:oligosaccharide flippase family protein [Candidatus Saccharibacteria bacterium]|jgi:O-antigen/teichoic acid export membrane protein|nr:oligosaccharide flippase family protein [Candidatus Saccharibacteria bacterium]
MSKSRQLAKNTLIIGFGKFASQFIGFFLLPLYTHFLLPEQYGTVDLIMTYAALLAPFIALQLDRGAFRHLIDVRGSIKESAKVISNTLRLVLYSLIISFALVLVTSLFIDIPYLLMIVAVVVSILFANLFMQFARGLGDNIAYAITSVVMAVTMISTVTWLVVFAGRGVMGVLVSLTATNIIAAIFLFAKLRLHRYISTKNSDRKLQIELLRFSLPLVPSAISWWVIQAADRSIISIFLGVASAGIYAAANRYAMILHAFSAIFDLSWNESASLHINSKDRDKFFSKVYNTSFRLFATMGLLLIAVTPFVFHIIIGDQFQAAQLLVPIIVTGVFFQSIVSQYSVIYIAKKITKQVLITSLSAATISLILNLVLIHWIGLYAAPIAMLVAFFVIAVWRHFDIKKYVKITFTNGLFIKLALLYAIILILYYFNNFYINIINLGIAALSFWLMSRQPAIAIGKALLRKIS